MAFASILGNAARYTLPKLLTVVKDAATNTTKPASNSVTFSKPDTTTTSVNVGYVDPKYPQIDYTTPNVEYPTWEEAYNKAKSVFEPKLLSAELSQNELARDQLKSLKQGLAAKGYSNLRGGQRIVGEENITQDQAAQLEKLRNTYNSLMSQYANDIFNQESSGAATKLSTLLADRNAKNQTALNLYQTDLNASLQKEANENNKYNSYFNYIYNLLTGAEDY